MLKPTPAIDAHSWSVEFHSFIWKLYTPPSRGVTLKGEHVDWAATFPGIASKMRPAAQAVARLTIFVLTIIHLLLSAARAFADSPAGLRHQRKASAVRSFPSGIHTVEIVS